MTPVLYHNDLCINNNHNKTTWSTFKTQILPSLSLLLRDHETKARRKRQLKLQLPPGACRGARQVLEYSFCLLVSLNHPCRTCSGRANRQTQRCVQRSAWRVHCSRCSSSSEKQNLVKKQEKVANKFIFYSVDLNNSGREKICSVTTLLSFKPFQ